MTKAREFLLDLKNVVTFCFETKALSSEQRLQTLKCYLLELGFFISFIKSFSYGCKFSKVSKL